MQCTNHKKLQLFDKSKYAYLWGIVVLQTPWAQTLHRGESACMGGAKVKIPQAF